MSLKNCNFCKNRIHYSIYEPKKSKIGLKVFICKNCGLVQTTSKPDLTKPKNTSTCKISKLSCDADYSEIRVGKSQMTHHAFECFVDNNIKIGIESVLDMCSARGHFAIQALRYFNLQNIYCIEPDEYMTKTYKNNKKINLFVGKYYESNFKRNFDLIYSCHTLEHFKNPSKNLDFIWRNLNENGLFFLDVPNIELINNQLNIDEFFYDYHKYYFNRDILRNYLESIGFEIIYENSLISSICFLCKKVDKLKKLKINDKIVKKNEFLIKNYIENISQNRDLLPNLSREIEKFVSENKATAVVGCGRLLDAFYTYGGLNLDIFKMFIDNHLINATESVYDKILKKTSDLKNSSIDSVVFFTKSSTKNLKDEVKTYNHDIQILSIMELLKSKR